MQRPSIKPHQVWQRPFVAAQRERIRRKLDRVESEAGGSAALRFAAAEAECRRADSTLQGRLARFLYACEALDRHARHGGLDGDEVRRLYRSAAGTLARNGIRPGTSRIAHLHGELHETMCRIAAREGKAWSAAWRHLLAKYEGGGAPEHQELFREVSLELQLGLAEHALARLLDAELPDTPAVAVAGLRLARARILRLGGKLDEAERLLDRLCDQRGEMGPEGRDLSWERACVATQRHGTLEPQARLLRTDRESRIPRRLLDFFLWSRAIRSKSYSSASPKAASLRRTAAGEIDPPALRCALAIERCYEGRGTVAARVQALGRALEEGDDIGAVDQQMLASLGIAKPFLRVLLPPWDLDGLLRELGDRVLEECNYEREAENQRYFCELLAGEPHIHVPAPIEELTTPRVLVTERVEGSSFGAFREQATQQERDRAGRAILRYVMKTVSAQHAFNTDMHPGNLLFSRQGVHFVDFGSVRRYEGSDTSGFPRIVAAVIAQDPGALRQAAVDLGFIRAEDRFDIQTYFELLASRALSCLVEDRPMRFDMEMIRRDVEMFFVDLPEGDKLNVPPKHLYFFRLYWGMFAVLSQLGSELNWRRAAQEVLDEMGIRLR